MDSYSFVACSAEEIDLPRIAKENEGAEAILVISGNALLMLSHEFLSKFQREDDLPLNGTYLSKVWGVTKVSVKYTGNTTWFETAYYTSQKEVPGYRLMVVEKSCLSLVKKQIEAARTFERKFSVHVKVL